MNTRKAVMACGRRRFLTGGLSLGSEVLLPRFMNGMAYAAEEGTRVFFRAAKG
ncbi:MAG: hypothetical protein ACI4P0_06205 [Mailhella sp.]